MKTPEDILATNLDWVRSGYTFDYIHSVYEKVSDEDHFTHYNIDDIQRALGKKALTNISNPTDAELKEITFIVIGAHDCNGELDFLAKCENIEEIYINSCSARNNLIKNIEPLVHLKKLKTILLGYHEISDLTPLSELNNIEHLELSGNPIKTIKPLLQLRNIKYFRIDSALDAEVLELVNNSKDAVVEYHSNEADETIKAFWDKKKEKAVALAMYKNGILIESIINK